jgi:peroxiredoxin
MEIGAKAPGFALRQTFEETVTLDQLIADGPLLLAFYVFDFGHA